MKGVIIKVVSVVIILGIFIFLSLMPSNFNTKRGSRIWISENRDIYFYESDKRGKMIVGNEVEDIFMETEEREDKSEYYMDFYQTDSNYEKRFNLMYGKYVYRKLFRNTFVLKVIQLYGEYNIDDSGETIIKNITFKCYDTEKTDINQLNKEMLEKATENDPIEYDCVRIYDPIQFNDEKSFFEVLEYYNVPKDSVKTPNMMALITDKSIVCFDSELMQEKKIAENVYNILENLQFTGKYVGTFDPYNGEYINFWRNWWFYNNFPDYFSDVRNQDVDEIPYGLLHIRMNYDDFDERTQTTEHYYAQTLNIDFYRSGDVVIYNVLVPQPNNGKRTHAKIYATAVSLEEVNQAFIDIENLLENYVTRQAEDDRDYSDWQYWIDYWIE